MTFGILGSIGDAGERRFSAAASVAASAAGSGRQVLGGRFWAAGSGRRVLDGKLWLLGRLVADDLATCVSYYGV